MSYVFTRRFFVTAFILLLSACTSAPKMPGDAYSKAARDYLYGLQSWHFEGRLAISSPKDAWSANADWRHSGNSENLNLSGPLGQGAVAVELADGIVKIDRGGGNVQSSSEPEQFISQQVGLFVPLESLRFWVVGLPDSAQDFQETTDGFVQAGWLIEYKTMQKSAGQVMPQKMIVSKDRLKLKLIIDQWDLQGFK